MSTTPEASLAIARAAYIYLYPLVTNYGAAYQLAIGPPAGPSRFGRWLHWSSEERPFPAMTGRPGTKPVSSAWLDLGQAPVLVYPPPPGWTDCRIEVLDLWGFAVEAADADPLPTTGGAPVLITTCSDASPGPDGGPECENGLVLQSETELVDIWFTRDPSRGGGQVDPGSDGGPVVHPVGDRCAGDSPPSPRMGWFEWNEAVLTGPDFWSCAAFALSLTRPHADDLGILELLRTIAVVPGVERDHHAGGESIAWAIDLGMFQAIEELMRGARGLTVRTTRSTRRQIDRDYFGRAVRTLAGPHLGRTRRGVGLMCDTS